MLLNDLALLIIYVDFNSEALVLQTGPSFCHVDSIFDLNLAYSLHII